MKWLVERKPINAICSSGLQRSKKSADCYFCLIKILGIAVKIKYSVIYPNISFVRRSVSYCIDLSVPIKRWSVNEKDREQGAVPTPSRKSTQIFWITLLPKVI